MSDNFYNKNASNLADLYLSKSFEQVHEPWLDWLVPILDKTNARILDLGAGAGRDSKYMAEQGSLNNVCITAVEPAQMLAELGKKQTQGLNVHWLQDALPDLNIITKQQNGFDLILLSAVWMHIPDSEREPSIHKLSDLLKPDGKLVISLRHGPCGDERKMFEVFAEQLVLLGRSVGLSPVLVTEKNSDVMGREAIHWQTVVFTKT